MTAGHALVSTILGLGLVVDGALAAPDSANELRPLVAQFASCVVKKNSKLAKYFANSRPGGAFGTKNFDTLFPWQCLQNNVGTVRFPQFILKGAVSEAIMRAEGGLLSDLDPSTKTGLDWAPATAAPVDAPEMKDEPSVALRRASLMQEAVLGQIGECVVRLEPVKVRELFLMRLNSLEEVAAVKAFAVPLSNCLPKGQAVPFSRTTVRSMLAMAYFRLAAASPINGATQ